MEAIKCILSESYRNIHFYSFTVFSLWQDGCTALAAYLQQHIDIVMYYFSSAHLADWLSCGNICQFGCDLPWSHPSRLVAVLGSTSLALPWPMRGWREGTRGRAISISLHIDCHMGMLNTCLPLWIQLLTIVVDKPHVTSASHQQWPRMLSRGLWPLAQSLNFLCMPACLHHITIIAVPQANQLLLVNNHFTHIVCLPWSTLPG